MTLPNGQSTDEGVETTPPEGDGAPVETPTTETPETETPTDQQPTRPGTTPQRPAPSADKELEWLRAQYQRTLQDLQATRNELREYEYAALDDDERGQREVQDRMTQLQEQEQALQEAAYAQGLWEFYTSYVPHTAIQGETPVEWQQSVLDYLVSENQRLSKEVTALKKAATPGKGAPKVPSQSGGKPQKSSVFGMSWEEIERLREGAEMGLIRGDDLPG